MPEFVYERFYNERGKMLGFRVSERGIKPQLLQMGLREPLLCASCEAHLNTHFEQPSQKAWRALAEMERDTSFVSKVVQTDLGHEVVLLNGFDYPSLKLFLLSILWRAGVSSRGEFQQVVLGRYEETLRRMLLERDPGDATEYPCLLFMTTEEFRGMPNPWHARFDSHRGYRFLFGRILLWFVVSRHYESEATLQGVLTKNGEWLAHMVELRALPEFRELLRFGDSVDVPERMTQP